MSVVSGSVLWLSLAVGKNCRYPAQRWHAAETVTAGRGLCKVSCWPVSVPDAAGVWEWMEARQEVESGSLALFPGRICPL